LTRTERQIEEFRKGEACLQIWDACGRPCAGVPVSVEQENHEFLFGCVVPDLKSRFDVDQQRYRARLDEAFNCLIPSTGPGPCSSQILRVDVAERIPLGRFRLHLDRLADAGRPLHVHVWGRAVGMTGAGDCAALPERDAGKRLADFYALCFAHPAVQGVIWNGFADGEMGATGGGLLRQDLAPKYAHKVLQKLVGSVWHTRASGLTDAGGLFRFRGFFGDYRMVADVGESRAHVETFTLARGGCSSGGTSYCFSTKS
jgi:hypothetical protein